ncbi:hypothetical protein D0469_07515 [Peribacillus saganii]|uniref:VCBS repeat-containing protein n=1 Tax=Peribacillus saganii TaxID=2303992 RepID=A0A372LQU8_9BACI|nr:hypothetical protein [Peribacillus saganii]RFU70426.1 hypothetical protein D0469_07515 [Peribacillus saganii]
MKKRLILIGAYLFIIVISVLGLQHANAANEQASKEVLIKTVKKDVTGDRGRDKVSLMGIPYEDNSSFFKTIYLVVKEKNGKQEKVQLDGGYEPIMKFADFNRDKVKDVLVNVSTGGSGGTINSYVYSFAEGNAKNLSSPPSVSATAQFEDDYKASIALAGQKPVMIDVRNRKKDYARLGLYSNGKLNEPTELMVDLYSVMKIVRLPSGKGLKGIQRVSGAYRADALAEITSVWFYENGEWRMVSASSKQIK